MTGPDEEINIDDLIEYELEDKMSLAEERLSEDDERYRDDIPSRVADMRNWG